MGKVHQFRATLVNTSCILIRSDIPERVVNYGQDASDAAQLKLQIETKHPRCGMWMSSCPSADVFERFFFVPSTSSFYKATS